MKNSMKQKLVDVLPMCTGYDVYIYCDGKEYIIKCELIQKAITLFKLGFCFLVYNEYGVQVEHIPHNISKRYVDDVVIVLENFIEISLN